MQNITLYNPSYPAGNVTMSLGNSTVTVVNGLVTVPGEYAVNLLNSGFGPAPVSGATGSRPAAAPAGAQFFDTTIGKPIWRNAAGSGWVLSDGTAA